MKNIFFAILILLSCTSCENFFSSTVDVDPPEHKDQMVIHHVLTDTDMQVAAKLGKSFGLLENVQSDDLIEGGTIEVLEEGQPKFSMQALPADLHPYNYGTNLSAPLNGNGKEFELIATHPDYGEIRARDRMPNVAAVTSVKYKASAGVIDGERANGVEVTFQDPAGEANFYEIGLYRLDQNFTYNISADTNDPLADESIDYGVYLLNDETFDGKEHKFTILSYSQLDTNVVLVIHNLTESLYRYNKSVRDQLDAEDFGLFAEPVSIFSNVENGLGIFGLRTERYYELEF